MIVINAMDQGERTTLQVSFNGDEKEILNEAFGIITELPKLLAKNNKKLVNRLIIELVKSGRFGLVPIVEEEEEP